LKIRRRLVLEVTLVFSILLIISSSYITSAFLITDTYRISGEITTGSGNLASTDLKNFSKIAVGQPIIGNISGGGYKICFGVFCTDVYQPAYSMNFSGTLNYSNGTFVKNAPVKVIVKYLTTQFEGDDKTNSSGQFYVKMSNLPEYIIGKDLNITFYVQGEIEAIYNCFYNYTCKTCFPRPGTKNCPP
jgi:hypothetical protein